MATAPRLGTLIGPEGVRMRRERGVLARASHCGGKRPYGVLPARVRTSVASARRLARYPKSGGETRIDGGMPPYFSERSIA